MPLALACMLCGAGCKQLQQCLSLMWGSCVSQGWGAAMTDADVAGIKAALEEFLVKALLPALQARVRGLHFQVRPRRRHPRAPRTGRPQRGCSLGHISRTGIEQGELRGNRRYRERSTLHSKKSYSY